MTPGEARAAALVRIGAGVVFLAEGYGKVFGVFVRGKFAASAQEMLATSWPAWASFLRSVVIPNAQAFAWLIALAELALGAGLLLGLLTRVAAACGSLLMLAILLGQSYVPGKSWDQWVVAGLTTKFALLLLLLLAAVNPGRVWGLDGRTRRGTFRR